MRLPCLAIVVAVPLLPPFTLSLPAQQPIRVLRHAPVDTVRPGEAITISFDRPVVGSSERTPDPYKIVRLDPPVPARIQWRDPTSLRIIPNPSLVPGQRYRITLTNEFTAVDGGQLEAPYRFTLITAGPKRIASIPGLHPEHAVRLEPNGRIRLVYSAPVDSAMLDRSIRLDLTEATCGRRTIGYRVRYQRAPTDDDGYEIQHAGGWQLDSIERSFHRLLEIRPATPLPEGCAGRITLPSLDPNDRSEITYPIATSTPFQLAGLRCTADDCAGETLSLLFSAPVFRDSLMRYLRLTPAVPFTVASATGPQPHWVLRLKLVPRRTYTVSLAPALTDMYLRRVQGKLDASVTTGDRYAALGHQLGFFTVSRSRPVLRVTHVNVDSAELAIIPIPDSLRATVLLRSYDPDSVARMVSRLRDTILHRVALPARFNVEGITAIPLPSALRTLAGGSLFAIRARPIERSTVDSTSGVKVSGQLREIRIFSPLYGPSMRTAIVQLTDLMAHARVSDDGGSVLVTDGSTGRPVSGARVATRGARDEILASGETDASGVASLAARGPRIRTQVSPLPRPRYSYGEWDDDVRFVEVNHLNDRSLTVTGGIYWRYGSGFEEIGGWPRPTKAAHASVFTDRGIYRPGEKIFVTSIIRLGPLANLRVPGRGDSVRVRLTRDVRGDTASRVVRTTVLPVSAFGTVVDSFALSRAATLGWYTATVDAYVNGWQTAATQSFQVAEYRAPEFETTLAIDSGVRFLGDTLSARVSAKYYFGAPMARAVVRWSASTVDAAYELEVPGLPAGFQIGQGYFGGGPSRPGRSDSESGVDTLDALGMLSLRLPTELATSTVPARVDVSVSVDDLNRQSVAASADILMHASTFYVAVRDSTRRNWYWSENVPRRFQVLAVRPDGKRVPNVRVTVATVRHHMRFVTQEDGQAPTAAWTTDTIARGSIVTGDSIASYTFIPRAAGWHEIIFIAADERGRPLRTALGGYVVGRDWRPWTSHPLRAAMSIDSSSVAPGDTLVVRFISPFRRAEAWVTVERETVLAQRRMRVAAGESVARIPVTESFIPGAQVSLLLVDSGVVAAKDSLHQRLRGANAQIRVSHASKRLTVDVTPEQPRYYPGDSARVSVSVRDHRRQGAPASVTLWAVDEGVLALDEYERPDPVGSIYGDVRTTLDFGSTLGSLASLGRFLTPPGWLSVRGANMLSFSAFGSQASSGIISINPGSRLRSDFRSTAFYVGAVLTDAAGRATARVELPDNLTTYRVMAVAVTAGDAYGSGEASIMLTKPLIARPALPRFLRTGDTILAGSVINNTTADTVDVRLTASGKGVVRIGDSTRVGRIAPGAGSEMRFGWRADGEPGDSGSFRFDLVGGPNRDAVQVALPMKEPYAPRYHALAGVTRGRSAVRLMLPPDIDPRRSRLTLRVGTSPAPIVQAAYARVAVYPYECSEQLTSTGQVILAMLRLQRAGVLDSMVAPDARTLRGRLQYIADELARRQPGSGGIGYWSAASWTDVWLSSYAGMLLLDARDAGVRIDSAVINGIRRFVRVEPDTPLPGDTEPAFGTRAERERMVALGLSQELAALHFLRRSGEPEIVRENRMLEATSRMVWEDRVWFVELLAGRNDRTVAREQLARVWRHVEMTGVRVDIPDSLVRTLGFRSHVRPTARLLRATRAIDPASDRIAPLIERIVQQGRAERDRVWNTQDYGIISSTLADIAIADKAAGPAATVTIRSGRRSASARVLIRGSGERQAESTITLDDLLERDGQWMALPLQVATEGAPTFYVVTVDEVPLAPPKTPDARGMIVERWFERFDDGRPVTEVTEGDLVRGRLRISVPSDREFVALEDLLPAGLELVDASLRTTELGPFTSEASREAEAAGARANSSRSTLPSLYGSWSYGWWSPWEHEEKRDDRMVYFARMLWKGTYTATYVARATTAGTFVRPPAHAEEMYNPSVGGRSDGSIFRVLPRP